MHPSQETLERPALTLLDARCTCGSYLWRRSVWTEAAGDVVEVDACPSCDRPRCLTCREPFGFLFAPHVRRFSLGDEGSRCPTCTAAPHTAAERRHLDDVGGAAGMLDRDLDG